MTVGELKAFLAECPDDDAEVVLMAATGDDVVGDEYMVEGACTREEMDDYDAHEYGDGPGAMGDWDDGNGMLRDADVVLVAGGRVRDGRVGTALDVVALNQKKGD